MSAVLCIGGLDSSGGAGLLRDAATVAGLGVAVRAAASAVTAQGPGGVAAVQPVDPATLAAQIAAAGPVAAVKTGMLCDAARVRAVAAALPDAPLVLDPVLAASSGRALLDPGGVAAMLDLLVPRAALVTPNGPERDALAALLGVAPADLPAALLDRGCGAVLVKGGHGGGPSCEDVLHDAGGRRRFRAPRLPGGARGTGCTLASAVAARLARGGGLAEAVADARAVVRARIRAGGDQGATSPR